MTAITDPAVMRRRILNLEEAMLNDPSLTPLVCPLRHVMADGVYARHIILPADSLVVGKIHKHSHHNFIQRGHVTVYTDQGHREYHGPCSFVSEPGTKRTVYAHEETLWITVHATTASTPEEAEDDIIAKDFNQLGLSVAPKEGTPCLG